MMKPGNRFLCAVIWVILLTAWTAGAEVRLTEFMVSTTHALVQNMAARNVSPAPLVVGDQRVNLPTGLCAGFAQGGHETPPVSASKKMGSRRSP
jgi:hypothetical protein